MTIQCTSSSSTQNALLTQLDPARRVNREREQQRQRELEDRENPARRSADQGIDYLAYTQKVVSRLGAAQSEYGNIFRHETGARNQQALSAYAAQQQSLDREQLDNVRNMLGVDYYV